MLARFATRRTFSSSAAPGPLAGLRVLELASVLAGPSVGQFLAELGADVLKVENQRTHGDVTRTWRLKGEPKEDTVTAYFSACNLGKRSIAIDASKAQGKDLCRRLAGACDIVVASYKPGDAEKLGLDAKTLRADNPKLVYAQITGYGINDPRVGYDALIQAEAGFTFINGQPGEAGRPTKMPVALVDLLAAHQLKEAILLALLQREKKGEGAHVHVSLMGAAVASLANQASGYIVAGAVPQRMGSDHPSICPYGTDFLDKDGKPLVLAVGSDAQFRSLCEILECPEISSDQKFSTNVQRVANRQELCQILADKIKQRSRDDTLEQLRIKKVPAGAIADMPTVFSTEQAQALVVKDSGKAVGMRQVAWLGDGVSEAQPSKPPGFAHHTAEILTDVLKMPSAEIKGLINDGIIEAPTWTE
eukprot:TRINITY_DN11347_c0_g1_i2.p1 TRINITY_DN11347_c0_g1~~TRINITY_DN11347_c0_g1_i2.p1  ORF type:complete len:419 (-),score=106.94 TRINITY_DN11347_c0_g1_i2:242-1498(-)